MPDLITRIYPNGEFGVSRQKRRSVHGLRRIERSEEEEFNSHALAVHGMPALLEYKRVIASRLDKMPVGEEAQQPGPIDSSLVSNSHISKRGSNGITPYGSKLVRNGSYLLQKSYGRSRLSFLTLTIPPLGLDGWEQLLGNWSRLVDRFSQWLRRRLVANGLPPHIVGCVEVQEKRLEKYSEPGYHLHLLFVGALKPWQWKLTPKEIRREWLSLLSQFSGQYLSFSIHGSVENLKSVRSSAQGYLGKYMSKGVHTLRRLIVTCPSLSLPPTWYVCSSALRRRIKSQTLVSSGDLAEWVAAQTVISAGGILLFRREIYVDTEIPGWKIWVGAFGRMPPELARSLWEKDRDAKKNVLLTQI